jgi:hypothetical protein
MNTFIVGCVRWPRASSGAHIICFFSSRKTSLKRIAAGALWHTLSADYRCGGTVVKG